MIDALNDIYRARNREELDFFLRYSAVSSMTHKQYQGTEFSVDIFCDLDSLCLNAIPCSMIHSKGGESRLLFYLRGRGYARMPAR
jgi:carbamoyl-phosphate synthase large subunit